jgi:hypothetical protein
MQRSHVSRSTKRAKSNAQNGVAVSSAIAAVTAAPPPCYVLPSCFLRVSARAVLSCPAHAVHHRILSSPKGGAAKATVIPTNDGSKEPAQRKCIHATLKRSMRVTGARA